MKVVLNKKLIQENYISGDAVDNVPKIYGAIKQSIGNVQHKVGQYFNDRLKAGKALNQSEAHPTNPIISDGEGHTRFVHDMDNTGGI